VRVYTDIIYRSIIIGIYRKIRSISICSRWDWRDRIRRSRRSVNGADTNERKHSLSLVYADWLDYDGVQVIAFEDDASRKILSIGEFANATTKSAIAAFKHAEELARAYRGYINAVNTDQGTQFYAGGGKKRKGVSRFEQYLNARGVNHIPSKRNNPQTNGTIERWFQEYGRHRWRFDSDYASQGGTITVSTELTILNAVKPRMKHLSGK
jgi:transposase InsO family protein